MSNSERQIVVITGGGGVLCSAIAGGLARAGTVVALLDLEITKANTALDRIQAEGGEGVALQASVFDRGQLESASEKIFATYGRIDVLINGAGGNHPKATTGDDMSFFDLPEHEERSRCVQHMPVRVGGVDMATPYPRVLSSSEAYHRQCLGVVDYNNVMDDGAIQCERSIQREIGV